MQQRQRNTLELLRENDYVSLNEKRALEVGCGRGGVLLEYLGYGANIDRLVGIDLLHDRLVDGTGRLSYLHLICADGRRLPFQSGYFDLVLQYTAFSSVLDFQVKDQMAKEIIRVLAPNGIIIWYDFWINPTNPHTKGIRKNEIKQLFPDCKYIFKKITLAPPIARRLVPISWTMSLLLEKLNFLNTHHLVLIRPK